MERKYFTEFGLNVYTSYKTLISIEALEEMVKMDDGHHYHIYALLSYPKIYFNKEKMTKSKDGISFVLNEEQEGKVIEYKIPTWNMEGEVDFEKVEIVIKHPGYMVHIEINDKDYMCKYPERPTTLDIPAQLVFEMFKRELLQRCDYEVLYIGQAYGRNGSRDALQRLSSHSTLQKILIDCQSTFSDRYIYVLLLEICPVLNTSYAGNVKNFTTSNEEDDEHIKQVLSDLPEERQVINITEAALINYFKPIYNRNFVDNFPDVKHIGYSQYYNLDYNALTVELDLSFDNAPSAYLYTDINKMSSPYQCIQYQLHNDPNRKNMYDIFEYATKD